MIYQFKTGAHVPKGSLDAETTGKELEKIVASQNEDRGLIKTITDTVEADRKHPLRPWFTWNVDDGMRKLHEQEAASLVRAVVVTGISDTQNRPMSAFVPVKLAEGSRDSIYQPVTIVLSDKDMRNKVFQDVVAQYESFNRKMQEFLNMVNVFSPEN